MGCVSSAKVKTQSSPPPLPAQNPQLGQQLKAATDAYLSSEQRRERVRMYCAALADLVVKMRRYRRYQHVRSIGFWIMPWSELNERDIHEQNEYLAATLRQEPTFLTAYLWAPAEVFLHDNDLFKPQMEEMYGLALNIEYREKTKRWRLNIRWQ